MWGGKRGESVRVRGPLCAWVLDPFQTFSFLEPTPLGSVGRPNHGKGKASGRGFGWATGLRVRKQVVD